MLALPSARHCSAVLLSWACGNVVHEPPPPPPNPHAAGTEAGGGGGLAAAGGSAGERSGGGSPGGGGLPGDSGRDSGGNAGEGTDEPPEPSGTSTPGCGLDPGQLLGGFVRYVIETSGAKDDDATGNPGPWTYQREYFVWLPPDYDNTRAYPLVFQGPGCGGNGELVYSLENEVGAGVGGQVIRVGLTPPPNEINHVLAPGGGCFDDREGDDSVEWPFYEGVVDALRERLCFDTSLVFASGYSTGAFLANELGCRYAGHPGYPIRGIAVGAGSLPTEPEYRPTCSDAPLAGIWVAEDNDSSFPFAGTLEAFNRAMSVNDCTLGTNYETATFDDYPTGGNNADDTCKKVSGCPESHPLVICVLPTGGYHGAHEEVANPAFSTFFQQFLGP